MLRHRSPRTLFLPPSARTSLSPPDRLRHLQYLQTQVGFWRDSVDSTVFFLCGWDGKYISCCPLRPISLLNPITKTRIKTDVQLSNDVVVHFNRGTGPQQKPNLKSGLPRCGKAGISLEASPSRRAVSRTMNTAPQC